MEGFRKLGFNAQKGSSRIPEYDLARKYQYKERKQLDSIKKNVLQRKIEREKDSLRKQEEELARIQKQKLDVAKKIQIAREDTYKNYVAKGKYYIYIYIYRELICEYQTETSITS